MTAQLDLFAEDQRAERETARAEWLARFERVAVAAPYDSAGGSFREGDTVLAWRCPSCAFVELSPYGLVVNHGYDPYIPGHEPGAWAGGRCYAARRRDAMAARASRPTP